MRTNEKRTAADPSNGTALACDRCGSAPRFASSGGEHQVYCPCGKRTLFCRTWTHAVALWNEAPRGDVNATARELAGLWLAGQTENVLRCLTHRARDGWTIDRERAVNARRCYLAVAIHRELVKAEARVATDGLPPSALFLMALCHDLSE